MAGSRLAASSEGAIRAAVADAGHLRHDETHDETLPPVSSVRGAHLAVSERSATPLLRRSVPAAGLRETGPDRPPTSPTRRTSGQRRKTASREWNEAFGPFTLDAAATAENALCERYFTVEDDGLVQSWAGERVWCNPPYSAVARWVEKACTERERAVTSILLVPSRTDTRWFQDYAQTADEVRLLPGRLKFSGAKNSAPFPSVLLVFRGGNYRFG